MNPPHDVSPPEASVSPSADTPPAFTAARLLHLFEAGGEDLAFIARSDRQTEEIAEAMRAFAPSVPLILFPAWDCLPYDRVAPSASVMGRRMEAIRKWYVKERPPALFVTSLEAMLQRIPPPSVATDASVTLEPGQPLQLAPFEGLLARYGYGGDGLVDEPGEAATRQDVVDIYPPSERLPVRLYLSPEGQIVDLKFYDPLTQRTQERLDRLVIGPATEVIGREPSEAETDTRQADMQRQMLDAYDDLATLFDLVGRARLLIAPDVEARVPPYVAIIAEARSARGEQGKSEGRHSLYLDAAEWREGLEKTQWELLDLSGAEPLPRFHGMPRSQRLLQEFTAERLAAGWKVVLCGDGRVAPLARRLGRALGEDPLLVDDWHALRFLPPGTVWQAPFPIRHGFLEPGSNLAIVTAEDVLGSPPVDPGARPLRLGLAEPDLRIGDVVVHEAHGVGVLKALETTEIDGVERDAVRLEYHGGASILVPMEEFGRLWRYGSEPEAVTLDRLHTEAWAKKRAVAEKDIAGAARHLVKLAGARRKAEGPVIEPLRAALAGFAARFPYTLTADQDAAVRDTLADLASGTPMNRLVVGDVGYGKTEIALRAAAAAALAGFQVVVLAPTTVLARQHALTFERRFAGTGINTALLSRAVGSAEAKRVKAELASGALQIVIATHAVLGRDLSFARLALLIVDEEQRFGAGDKEKMQKLASGLHVLTMSATPIPRTLQSALVGIQDVSLLATPPARRRPVRTALAAYDAPLVRSALLRERRRSGQSFFVVPRIEDIARLEEDLARFVPEFRLITAHGNLPAAELDDRVLRFANGEADVLLATNVIESGLDIPNANTIFVWRSELFGLAQLHQLRGRVGRSRAQGFAFYLTEPGKDIADETRNRLATMVELDRLGSGIEIAMRDLDLRGAGDLAGKQQAGHLKIIGISLYQKLLADAVAALGGRNRVAEAPAISIGAPGFIPPTYVPDALVRLNLYSRLMRLATAAEIDDFEDELYDRFGQPPDAIGRLMRLTRLRIRAGERGIRALAIGPKALAVCFTRRGAKPDAAWKTLGTSTMNGDRHIFPVTTASDEERLALAEALLFG